MCTIVVKKQLFEALKIGQLTQADLGREKGLVYPVFTYDFRRKGPNVGR
jgi:hypothetical protein